MHKLYCESCGAICWRESFIDDAGEEHLPEYTWCAPCGQKLLDEIPVNRRLEIKRRAKLFEKVRKSSWRRKLH